MAIHLPTTLLSTYRLTRLLGSGGMGSVYAAEVDLDHFDFALVVAFNEAANDSRAHTRNPELLRAQRLARYQLWQSKPRDVLRRLCERHPCPYPRDGRAAVKVLHPHLATNPVARSRFQLEWQALLSLASPHLVQVFGAGVDDASGAHFYAMELLDSQLSEAELLQLPVSDKLLICAQAAAGLSVLHRHGLLHRDIKPRNIFTTRRADGLIVAKVADLGIAKDLAGDELTATGDVFGTRFYMAPELLAGSRNATVKTDVYALGATLYELLAGDPPFKEASQSAQVALLATGGRPRSLVERTRGAVPEPLEAIVFRWMHPDPAGRPDSMAQVIEEARAFLNSTTREIRRLRTLPPPEPEEPPPSEAEPPAEPAPESTIPVVAPLAILALLAAVASAVLSPVMVVVGGLVAAGLGFAGLLVALETIGREALPKRLGLDRLLADPGAALRSRPALALTIALGLAPLAALFAVVMPGPPAWVAAGLQGLAALVALRPPRKVVELATARSGQLVLIKGDQVWIDDGREDLAIGRQLLEAAIAARASDIHLEPQDADFRVRFRIDGMLQEHRSCALAMGALAINQLKVLAELDITERRLPQDGSFSGSAPGRRIDFRVSTIPGVQGEKMVVRLLDKTFHLLSLSDLGMRPTTVGALEGLVNRPQGMLLVTGPSGGGKTTTLYSLLRQLDATRLNVVTIEDPVEYMLPDVCQIPVNVRAGLDYAGALRSSLRQDADVIMVGEIREDDAAKIAVEASLASHLVLSTMHADDPLVALLRLAEFGVPPAHLAQGLTAILSQRLVRRLCETCRRRGPAPPDLLAKLALDPALHPEIWLPGKDAACTCGGSGYRGRTGLFELLVFDEPFRELLRRDAPRAALLEHLRSIAHDSMRDDALRKAADGRTSLEEVRRVLS